MTELLPDAWFQGIQDDVVDPLLGAVLSRLGMYVNSAINALSPLQAGLYFDSVLNVCRTSQHVRLHTGQLYRLDPQSKDKVRSALSRLVDAFQSENCVADEHLTEYRKAIENIQKRLKFVDVEEPAAVAF